MPHSLFLFIDILSKIWNKGVSQNVEREEKKLVIINPTAWYCFTVPPLISGNSFYGHSAANGVPPGDCRFEANNHNRFNSIWSKYQPQTNTGPCWSIVNIPIPAAMVTKQPYHEQTPSTAVRIQPLGDVQSEYQPSSEPQTQLQKAITQPSSTKGF